MIITADVYRIFADARQVHVVCTLWLEQYIL